MRHPQRRVGMEQRDVPAFQRLRGCPIANVLAKNSGARAKDAPAEKAGGLSRKTYICKGVDV